MWSWSWWPCFSEGRNDVDIVEPGGSSPSGGLKSSCLGDGSAPRTQSTDVGGSATGSPRSSSSWEAQHEEHEQEQGQVEHPDVDLAEASSGMVAATVMVSAGSRLCADSFSSSTSVYQPTPGQQTISISDILREVSLREQQRQQRLPPVSDTSPLNLQEDSALPPPPQAQPRRSAADFASDSSLFGEPAGHRRAASNFSSASSVSQAMPTRRLRSPGDFRSDPSSVSNPFSRQLSPMDDAASDGGFAQVQRPAVRRVSLAVSMGSRLSAARTDGTDSGDEQDVAAGLPMYRHTTMDIPTLEGAGRQVAVASFGEMLKSFGVDLPDRGTAALYGESREKMRCAFAGDDVGGLKRIVRQVQIRLLADIFGVEHFLYTRLEIDARHKAIEKEELPKWSLQWEDTERIYDANDGALYDEESSYCEDLVHGCRRALRRLGLSMEWQGQHLEEDVHLSTFGVEPAQPSAEYPGLTDIFVIHEVVFRLADPASPEVSCIGLPIGQEFATREGRGSEARVKIWSWCRSSCMETTLSGGSPSGANCRRSPIKRVPVPALSGASICLFQQRLRRGSLQLQPPSPVLRIVQEERKTDWTVVESMSQRIRDSDYTLDAFYKDLCAFPELDLYLLENDVVPGLISGSDSGAAAVISGRTIGDEYQRTVGAFFAFYWLMRLSGDGRNGFCFGVDEKYRPICADEGEERLYPAEKRLKFYKESQWDRFDSLLYDAGVLVKNEAGEVAVNAKRVATVLALTAVHDIMKVKALLPTVAPAHQEYNGYVPGDEIGDHDHALGYIMDYFPELLPSFNGLEEDEQRSVRFTQCDMCFNHGWLVQAEAPPGAIFRRMRQVLRRSEDKVASARDVALYFVHWITDLAGAEPTPLGGCEKFVIKFPLPVLNSFLRSFSTVGRIATETETEVMEGYLLSRWAEHTPPVGPPPSGPAAIAKMRLLCMAQMNAVPILEAFDGLGDEDRALLSEEMAMTACEGQAYSPALVPADSPRLASGPAFLVYYGPAYLQSLGSDNAVARLQLLAQIYRVARTLWPASPEEAGGYVTVRIDAIKCLSIGDMRAAEELDDIRWAVVRKNNNEAFVDPVPMCWDEALQKAVPDRAFDPSDVAFLVIPEVVERQSSARALSKR